MSPSPLSRRLAALLFAATLALGAAACSSGEKTETSTSGDASAGDAASEAKELNESAKDVDKALGAGGCYQAAAAWATIVGKPMELSVSGASKEDLDAYRKQIEEFRSDVDESIRDDYDVLSSAYTQYAEALTGIDMSNPAALMNPEVRGQLEEASELLETPEVKQAQDNVQAYFANCESRVGN